jgi:ankyrin repeat protein
MGRKGLDRLLYDAVKKGDAAEVERLLLEGGNPNAPVGKKGMTCMTRAVLKKNLAIEKLLVEHKGIPDRRSTLGG